MWGADQVTYSVVEVIVGNPAFNYFFTVLFIGAMISLFCGLMCRIISRS